VGMALIGGAGHLTGERAAADARRRQDERKEMRERGLIGDVIIDNLSSGDAIFSSILIVRRASLSRLRARKGSCPSCKGASPTVACRLARLDELDAIKIEPNRK
jgi:hypothetical protein